jgi:hypothetical protein
MPFNPTALAQAQTSGFDEPPPPADYDTELVKAEIFESKSGETFLRLHYRVIAGAQRDHEWSVVHSLEEHNRAGEANPALGITARVLSELGIELEQIDSIIALRKALDMIEGNAYRVEVKRNGQYVNTTPMASIEQRIAKATESTPPAQAGYGEPPRTQKIDDMVTHLAAQTDTPSQYKGLSSQPASDVSSDFAGAPQRGSIDPETGQPIPF